MITFYRYILSLEIYINVVKMSSHHIQEPKCNIYFFMVTPQMYCRKNNLANKIWCNIGWLSHTREPYLLHGTWNLHVNHLLWQFSYSNSFHVIVLAIFRKWKIFPNVHGKNLLSVKKYLHEFPSQYVKSARINSKPSRMKFI